MSVDSSTNCDCIVLGQGLAGTTLAWHLLWRGARILVLDRDDPRSASRVAAGLMTPVTGQRLVPSWRLAEFWPAAVSFYRRVESETGAAFFSEPGQVRLLAGELERKRVQNRDRPEIADWIREPAPPVNPEEFRSEHGSFEMPRAARLNVAAFLEASRSHFRSLGIFREADVDPKRDIQPVADSVQLERHNATAGHLVFCQGFAAAENVWFADIRFDATRGEILTLRIPGLTEPRIVNRGLWLVPLGNGLFRAGATSDWNNLDAGPTAAGREDICARLREFLRLPFEVVEHVAGVRPIVEGRHPVLGLHPLHPRLGIFNGLGSKGSLQAPCLAAQLVDLILDGKPIDQRVDVADRFPVQPARPVRLTDRAHEIVRSVVKPGETVIDATAGNGHDAHFLASLVGPDGMLFAFDVQAAALERTGERLAENGLAQVTLLQRDHAQMKDAVPSKQHGRVAAVMFNLGWLPGSDKSVITQTESTLSAIHAALQLVRPGGVITILAYPGHPGGDEETAAVRRLFSSLDKAEFDIQFETAASVATAPRLFVARRFIDP